MNASALRRLSYLFACTALVAGCGGSGGDNSPPPPSPPPPPPAADQVPMSAFVSPESLFSFALEQTTDANTVETSEPLKFDLITAEPPTSDDSEPSPLT
ncbi:MAG TPA: hypothetical protein VFY73_19935 [Ideonella sp.]|uniref:hypothetical protein n=1 Tax=Ideonella sp. TaxID=1929293 RepID=UPI002E333C0C|nr:hypothetical protein [Ideonella sp.]HEX5686307.1 hypothetical protein [Ideonella sp.]